MRISRGTDEPEPVYGSKEQLEEERERLQKRVQELEELKMVRKKS